MVMNFHQPKTARCQEVWWCMRMGCLARTGTVALVSLLSRMNGGFCLGAPVAPWVVGGMHLLQLSPTWSAGLMGEFMGRVPYPHLRRANRNREASASRDGFLKSQPCSCCLRGWGQATCESGFIHLEHVLPPEWPSWD